ncbi:GLPGLI family protein [Psychroserpens sp. XS_ASV72]|uniref:GLPGLI family protein n=1 Tax=Psychroserpens sp. XS_ASV72 TaxID=3241293 RepID=UPI0035199AA1
MIPSIARICTVALLCFTTLTSAQDFQGQAIYQTKTTVDMSSWGGEMSEQQKKMIAERMKSMLEKTYVLNFNRSESTYKEEEKLEAPGSGGGGRFRGMMSSFTGGPQYKSIKENVILQEQEFFGKQFLVKDSLPELVWKLEDETKQIGQYTCFKATTTKKVDEMDFMSMRRRGRNNDEKKEAEKKADSTKATDPMDEIEVPKFIVVTAWYTPQIPVSNGPAEYHGLPGLILEVSADRTVMLCTKIVMNPQDKEPIDKPSKGDLVTRDEYNTIMKEKIEEMREMYGGRGRGRGR